MELFDLLIIYNDSTEKVVCNVTHYGFEMGTSYFWFEKNNSTSFVPIHAVRFFGKRSDYVQD